jgi:hypothetical protein
MRPPPPPWLVATLALALAGAAGPLRADEPPQRLPMALSDGDRVAFVGATFVERDAEHGYLETRMAARLPDREVRFRNFGWSGDTVWGEARARFGPPAEGFAHLKERVAAFDPTVVLVAYGANEADAGAAGLPRFRDGLGKMLDMLGANGARLVLVAPLDQEALGPPLPDPSRRNEALAAYRLVLHEVGAERKRPVIDLTDWQHARTGPPLTDNGVHLTPRGAWEVSHELARRWLGEPPAWRVRIDADGRPEASGTTLSEVARTPAGVRFRALDGTLPPPAPPEGPDANPAVLAVADLPPGSYTLRLDGEPVAKGTAEDWAKGVALSGPSLTTQTDALRRAIGEKNVLFFHRWRPQNETYLYGFRKHEQGRNAAEVPRFDSLVTEGESRIAALRRPRLHTFELTRDGAPTP